MYQSGPVVFTCGPVAVWPCLLCILLPLEPIGEVKSGLVNSTATEGEEASFTVELSAVCSSSWSLNGHVLRSGEDYLITRNKTTHVLLIRYIRQELNGATLLFTGGGAESMCTLSVKGELGRPPARPFRVHMLSLQGDPQCTHNANCCVIYLFTHLWV